MVPGALGTQTVGSVIRPASFCGTVGFKPSYGLIPRSGVLRQSPFLDQIGVFARSVEDVAILAEVMMGADQKDPESLPHPIGPWLHKVCVQQPPLPPKVGWVKTSAWESADADCQQGCIEVIEALGSQAEEVTLPSQFDQVWQYCQIVNEAEMATWYASIYRNGQEHLGQDMCEKIERGQKITAEQYINAKAQRAVLNDMLRDYFDEYDALITPAAVGQAPHGLSNTGDPKFSRDLDFLWHTGDNTPTSSRPFWATHWYPTCRGTL